MKKPHLLKVDDPIGRFAPLFERADERAMRLGWLELDEPALSGLELGGEGDPFKQVVVGRRRTLAVKRRRGDARLDDLIREHFLGCALLLLRVGAGGQDLDEVDAPELRPTAAGWRVSRGERGVELDSDALLDRLSRASLT